MSGLDKHWRDKWAEELKALGHEVPDEWTKDQVKDKLNEVKGLHPKERTKEEATAAIDEAVRQRIAEQDKQIAEMKAMLAQLASKPAATEGNLAGLTGDALVKAIVKAADGRQDEYGLIRSEYIPEGDEIPVRVYYMAGPTTNIWGKEVGGTMTPPPLGRKFIKFREAYGWVNRGATGIQQRRISTYECRSKTIADWIESLPEYGRSINLNMDVSMQATVNGEFNLLYNKHKASLSQISYGQVMQMAKEMGCATNMGFTHDDYAGFVAEQRALKEMENNKKRFDETTHRKLVGDMTAAAYSTAR